MRFNKNYIKSKRRRRRNEKKKNVDGLSIIEREKKNSWRVNREKRGLSVWSQLKSQYINKNKNSSEEKKIKNEGEFAL
jgi:hypothetical protein